ncbi:pilin [Patescibacteria group bacterium]|nr:pilin [Patescibacteria group bacterium]MBU1448540.1 pilin [Patescibacteria group bacterium]MBU2613624.1 pilin [Patescibacteria group bacterium]
MTNTRRRLTACGMMGVAMAVTLFASLPQVANADVVTEMEANKTKFGFIDELRGADVPTIINGIISSVLALVGALFFVMFLWGGFTWMIAGGDSKKVESARKALTNAVIGLLIVGFAYAIVTNVFDLIVKARAPQETSTPSNIPQ